VNNKKIKRIPNGPSTLHNISLGGRARRKEKNRRGIFEGKSFFLPKKIIKSKTKNFPRDKNQQRNPILRARRGLIPHRQKMKNKQTS